MPTVTCPVCRGANVEVESRRVSDSSKGRTVHFWEEFSQCRDCGETFFTREQSLAGSRAYTDAVREAEGFLSASEVRAARLALRMTQAQFEEALGIGKKTVVRWERGTVAPNSTANGMLWLAARYPRVFLEYVRERAAARGDETDAKDDPVVGSIGLASSLDTSPTAMRFGPPMKEERIKLDSTLTVRSAGSGKGGLA